MLVNIRVKSTGRVVPPVPGERADCWSPGEEERVGGHTKAAWASALGIVTWDGKAPGVELH